jgi:hypothetical protein
VKFAEIGAFLPILPEMKPPVPSITLSAIERQIIADIARVAALAPTIPSNYLSKREYESRGGRFTREHIKRGSWKRYHAAARELSARAWGHRDTAQAQPAPALTAQNIIDDILLVCRRQGWPQGARPSFKEYRQLGGRHPIVNISRAGGWLTLCARAGLHTPLAQLQQAPVDLATIVADVRRVARLLERGDGATLTSMEYRTFGGQYYTAASACPGGWSDVCAAAGLALPRRKTQKHRPRRKWQRSTGVWCGAAELTPSETISDPASNACSLPAEPAAALDLAPTPGELFVRGTFDPNFSRRRAMKRKKAYYRTRLVSMARQAAER